MIAQWRPLLLVMHVLSNLHDEPLDFATSLLQTRARGARATQHQIQGQGRQKRAVKENTTCTPSQHQDALDTNDQMVKRSNKTLIWELTSQGRIQNGFPDWNFVHIPKTGGDSMSISSAPLFPVGMGGANTNAPKLGSEQCFFQQLPPKMAPFGYGQESYRGKTIFCAVRNPYERAISGACHLLQYMNTSPGEEPPPINASMLDSFLRTQLDKYKFDKKLGTCFWIPQVEYTEGPLGCTRVINFAHLEQEYNSLMEEAGYPLRLGRDISHRCAARCDYTKDDLDPSTVKLLSDFYAADFEAWGQEFGWTK